METGRPTVYSTDGMVATPHYLATKVGLDVLSAGGSAIDAVLAANAVLHLVIPHQCHLGGDLFAIVWDPRDGELRGLNASGPAPKGSSVDQIRELGHEAMPERGELAVTIPGTVAGWTELHDRYGRHDLASLLAPAIAYAERGVPISAKLAEAIVGHEWLLERDEAAHSTFSGRENLRAGDIIRQPALAGTLKAIAAEGRDGFYRGDVAEDIVERLRQGGSAIELEDLASFEPEWVEPVSVHYRDVELVELPANSQGPAALLLALLAEEISPKQIHADSAALLDLEARAVGRVFEDRDRFLSDPRFGGVEEDRFTSVHYAGELLAEVSESSAPALSGVPGEDGDTAYLCAVDRDGLAVSLIQSVYMGFGSGVMAPRSGVLFQNRAFSFSLQPDHVNVLAGGKRPRHTLIPAMLLRDARPWTVFGAMGGDGQAQTHLQLLHQLVDRGRAPQEAIEAPRWLRQATPDGRVSLRVEPAFGGALIDELRGLGHEVVIGDRWDQRMGHAQMIQIDSERGVLAGGADPRGDGLALGI